MDIAPQSNHFHPHIEQGSMDLIAGAMGNLAPKLLQLLQDEYKLQKGVKLQVESLSQELKSMHVALCKVAQVPHDCLDPQVKLWASEVREASYDMEDVVDTFFVRVDGGSRPADIDAGKVKRLVEKMGKMFSLSKLKARRDIAGAIEDIKQQVDKMAKRRERYRVDHHVDNPGITATSIDPRVLTLHTKVSELKLVGIDRPRDELINMLIHPDNKMKIVCIVGSGGLGKTTVAKVVYEKLTVDMNIQYKAFVPVGQKPGLKKVLRDILLGLDKSYNNKTNFTILDEGQLIQEIQDFLKEKRYFIVIDDVWELSSWNFIRAALEDSNMGNKIIITTRCNDVAESVCCYKLKPLCPESSKILFYERVFESENMCPESFSELSSKLVKKCGGVPLAIITISSLLANKSHDITEWEEVCSSIGSGLISSSNDMYNDMRKILSLSYYDLPPHMKTCFLYLSIYPEDYEIDRDQLIWKWISEGFIQPKKNGDNLFELGESYFNALINRSLLQPVGIDSVQGIYACRVHDMILDLICSLSREENFVTMSDDIESSGSKKLRRLSIKNSSWPKSGVSQVRSVSVFLPSMDSMPSFSNFDVLRVLDLEGCPLYNFRSSKLCVRNLIHLRYLGLIGTGLKEVPQGLEKLQFLQVLNMDYVSMPPFIFGLRRLMCLQGVACRPKSGKLLRNLTSLHVLDTFVVDQDSAEAVEELGHLAQLTSLNVEICMHMDQSICDAIINSLGNLQRLQKLWISHDCGREENNLIKWECWSPPRHLRQLHIRGDFSLRMLPKWISPASLPHLTFLELGVVRKVRSEDIQMLGLLPNLLELCLFADPHNLLEEPRKMVVVSADAFPRLIQCIFVNFVIVPSMFTRGAMPKAERIRFCLRAKDFFSNGGLDFDDLAVEHLPSLKEVLFCVYWKSEVSKEEWTKLKKALCHAGDAHQKHPSICIDKEPNKFWRGIENTIEDRKKKSRE